ncbi:low molecular weight protein-tyrosine-phosphatase [Aliiglaciecola sp. LCG003]|uniref:low molecular weight protein-tyrosine-phosphatase n=1 Tax=Aliiglaciecola sp. LCG003 TaxID=3053655 RepID=UPI00257381B8|nr:low molecular weight protein-tyrosine-phosphatase [Aliiglaciecola sp. LCG003]WJG08052.1 low molecular weight protein-tyrosine-phosphatase [Aliiglaciecola sp. LCG003]
MAGPIKSVLFVCLGNICRSPTAEAVFLHKVKQRTLAIEVDSAGTQGFHTGCAPDERSQQAGEARGYSFEGLKCRKVEKQDFEYFDLIIAMDEVNLRNLQSECPEELHEKIHLFMSFSALEEDIVPDPYYGGKKGFEYVLDLIESASDGLLNYITRRNT